MTPERIAGLVLRWVSRYTRELPPAIAERRMDEVRADLHDHIAHERAGGTRELRIALAVLSRLIRGLPADVSWRDRNTSNPAHRSAVRVVLVTALVLLVPLATTLLSDGPGWSAFDFAFAAVLLLATGALLELAARKRSNMVVRVTVVAIAIAAIALGEADDAPGLVLFGLLVIGGTVALSLRTAAHSE